MLWCPMSLDWPFRHLPTSPKVQWKCRRHGHVPWTCWALEEVGGTLGLDKKMTNDERQKCPVAKRSLHPMQNPPRWSAGKVLIQWSNSQEWQGFGKVPPPQRTWIAFLGTVLAKRQFVPRRQIKPWNNKSWHIAQKEPYSMKHVRKPSGFLSSPVCLVHHDKHEMRRRKTGVEKLRKSINTRNWTRTLAMNWRKVWDAVYTV